MLILTRRPLENIIIGDDIVIKILDIQRGQVKVGIGAPKNISVHREEVYNKIKRENEKERGEVKCTPTTQNEINPDGNLIRMDA